MSVRSEIVKLPRVLLGFLFVPLYFIPSLVLAALGIRFVRISAPGLMGHLAIEPDCYLKDMRLGRQPMARPILLPRTQVRPANQCLYDYWRDHFGAVENRVAFALLSPFRHFPYLQVRLGRYANTVKRTADCYSTFAAWGNGPPILALQPDHAASGDAVLRELGVPEGAWFVCFHARESRNQADRSLHDHRNSAISDCRLAMAEIVARGGWCIRVGSIAVEPLAPMEGVIDYPHSGLRSDWMDVFLCARCRFFVGNTSGLFLTASIFGVPVVLANMVPLGCVYALSPADLSIPKLVADASGRPLPFAEILGSPAGDFRSNEAFEEARLSVVDNTPDEIRALVVEMIDRLEDQTVYDSDDEQHQEAFRRLMRPGHYSYGSASRIGRDFLRRHADLLDDASAVPRGNASGPRRLGQTVEQFERGRRKSG